MKMSAPPPPAHLVGRLIWDSGFDDPSEVRAQQDWLSDFSRHSLPDLLADIFDRCCPPGHTWRCDRLELDLGTIPLSRASDDLPQRLATALTSALLRHFGAFSAPPTVQSASMGGTADAVGDKPGFTDEEAGEQTETKLALLDHLLRHGTLPWWQQQPAGFLSLWEGLLTGEAGLLLDLLRRIGRQETVRKRLVWQLGRPRLPALIRLAEPAHAAALVEWVGDLVARHADERLVQDDASGFEQAVWLALLTCLFSDRGSLFNLTDFTSAHLRQLANSYGIPYAALRDRLEQISHQAAPHLPPRFQALIRAILARDIPPSPVRLAAAVPDAREEREWRLWSRMLSRGLGEWTPPAEDQHEQAQGRPIRLQSLFTRLAARDGRRLARTMVAAGASAGPVLARHLDDRALRRTIILLQPAEAEFILAHISYSQHLAQRRHWPRRAIWDVVLSFLLSDQASRFERRQLVATTLRESCRRHSTDLAASLALLIAYAQVAGPDPRHYILLQILLDLQAEWAADMPMAADPHSAAGRAVAADPWKVPAPAAPVASAVPTMGEIPPPSLIWKALRWHLRMGRAAPDLPPPLKQMPLATLWEHLPAVALRRWLLAQPDRAHLLPQLAVVPAARRWLSRLVPYALRPVEALLDQAVRWFGGPGQPIAPRALLEPVVWHLALDPRAASLAPALFLAQCLLLWCQRLGLGVAACAARGLAAPPSPLWREAFAQLLAWAEGRGIDPLPLAGPDRRRAARPDAWGQWLETSQGQAQMLRLLCRHSPPALHRRHGVGMLPALGTPDQRLATAVYQWAWTRPDSFRRLLAKPWRRASVRPALEARLQAALALPHLLDLVGRDKGTSATGRQAIRLIGEWQAWQRRLNLPHAGRREAWLWRMVWEAWLHQDWRALEPARLLAAFRQFVLPLAGLKANRLDERMQAARPPAAIAAALAPPPPERPARPATFPPADRPMEAQRLPLSNAGLVLLHAYLPPLFERLSLMRERKFVSPAAAHRALLALQFLACGRIRAEEPQLVLNKLLCGLMPSDPVPVEADFAPGEIGLMEGLLRAVIGHWPQSGASSLDGFRGSWLLRDGILADNADHWGLTVVRRPWDILLSKSPFSYAVIKLPWMGKPVYVTWPS
ncbi:MULTISPECIES: contractile injection system tape measure protein [unclassified Azospirillum]|uniref:contractile injection system tape measure protein n=1 Tax=unclassified Azospirillum TaxID=2630922 RepID=UPI000B6C0767|nr:MULTISPECIES: contractile injection system tape measure protein [unclassified Azospirillum]SNS81271.1 hypothetical protein SAMN05880556_11284 [Azospirillum sp. RU38E]SNS98369.1 hypothetical protein SAMN05880591_11284 [Azospirillum sp. RU37A]